MSNISTKYWIDAEDRLIKVSETWDTFAENNDGRAVVSEAVIGKRLWQFVTGDITRMWVETVINRARFLNQPIEKEYRCDSPDEKRYMQMSIVPEENEVLCVVHKLLKTEKLPTKICFEGKRVAKPGYVQRCSICNRLHIDNAWREVDLAVKERYIDAPGPVIVFYGVCDECVAALPRLQGVASVAS